jgi:hypothetical protein
MGVGGCVVGEGVGWDVVDDWVGGGLGWGVGGSVIGAAVVGLGVVGIWAVVGDVVIGLRIMAVGLLVVGLIVVGVLVIESTVVVGSVVGRRVVLAVGCGESGPSVVRDWVVGARVLGESVFSGGKELPLMAVEPRRVGAAVVGFEVTGIAVAGAVVDGTKSVVCGVVLPEGVAVFSNVVIEDFVGGEYVGLIEIVGNDDGLSLLNGWWKTLDESSLLVLVDTNGEAAVKFWFGLDELCWVFAVAIRVTKRINSRVEKRSKGIEIICLDFVFQFE